MSQRVKSTEVQRKTVDRVCKPEEEAEPTQLKNLTLTKLFADDFEQQQSGPRPNQDLRPFDKGCLILQGYQAKEWGDGFRLQCRKHDRDHRPMHQSAEPVVVPISTRISATKVPQRDQQEEGQ